ncbi:YihY/virulence factor BrkB family protein [Ligilactobacillus faecis]|uniref:YihY/virulence factor BrkB family protein n=1 Tax=Ligilactobacillus faecis TaxID=762833 RepID=A0ABV4DR95_9LACO
MKLDLATTKKRLACFRELFQKNFKRANVSSTAIVISYYTLVTIFPMIIFIGNILPLLRLEVDAVLPYLETAMPKSIYATLEPLIVKFLQTGASGSVASISGLVTLWATSRGINALKQAFNQAYDVGNDQGVITQRLLSFLIMIFIGVMLIILFVIYSFGQLVLEHLTPLFELPTDWLTTFSQLKWPTTVLGLFLIFIILYFLVPNAKVHLKYIWPGAVVATLGWMMLTQVFSIYVRYFARSFLSYGTIGTFIVLLLWLNYSAYVIMVGVVINASLEELRGGKVKAKGALDHFTDNAVKKQVKRVFKKK